MICLRLLLDVLWSKNCVIYEISRLTVLADNPDANPPVLAVTATATTSVTFQTNNAKPYVPVVTFSINNNTKFLEYLK